MPAQPPLVIIGRTGKATRLRGRLSSNVRPHLNTLAVIAGLFGGAAIALYVVILRRLGPLRPNIVRLQLTFSERSFRRVLTSWGEAGVGRFQSHFALDYAFLACYAAFGVAAGSWLVAHATVPSLGHAVLPWLWPAAAVFDAVENKLHKALTGAEPGSLPPAPFLAAGIAATAKWLLLVGAILVAGFAWLSRAA